MAGRILEGRIIARPVLGGLHHEYEWLAARPAQIRMGFCRPTAAAFYPLAAAGLHRPLTLLLAFFIDSWVHWQRLLRRQDIMWPRYK